MIQQCSLRSTNGRWTLLSTTLASGAAFLASSTVPIALPAIQTKFNTALSGLQWVVNANLVALGALILIGGALGDQFGRKRIFMIGLAIFTGAALISGFSTSLGMLLASQAIQGAGAALMVPQSLAIINDCFPKQERGRAIGLWAGISGAIAAAGPLVGGWLVSNLSWQWVFFMIAPVGMTAMVITFFSVPPIPVKEKHKLDWPGAFLVLVGLFGVTYSLISGPDKGWQSTLILVGLIGGAAAIVLFILVETRQKHPLVQLKIFKNPLVAGANAVTLFLYFSLNGVIFFTVLNLQQVQGYSPTKAGLAILPVTLLITLLTGPAGVVADRRGPRLQMIIGPLMVSIGMALLATGGSNANYLLHFLPGLCLFGAGMAAVIPPLTKSALSVEPNFSGSASGVNNGIARIAGLLAVALLGVVVLTTFSTHLTNSLADSELNSVQRQEILQQSSKLGGITIPDNFDTSARQVTRLIVQSSFIDSYRLAMILCAILVFASAGVSFLTIHNGVKTEGGEA